MKTTVVLIALVAFIAVLVRLLEPRMAFFPYAGETTTPRDVGFPYEGLIVETKDGERLRAWLINPPKPGSQLRAHILYFHGNGGNLSVWAPILAGVVRRGYSVFAIDYRGYGISTGRPTESGLYRDVDAALERFWRMSPSRPIVYWGRSLGGSMAAYAATVRPPDGLIMESTFPDVKTLVRTSPPMAILSLFSSYRFPAAEFLQRRSEPRPPVLVMHGDRDGIIGFSQGRELFERIPEPKRFVTIPGGDHNDLTPPDPTAYWKAVDEFIAGL